MAKATDHLSKQFSVLAFHNINMIIAEWVYDIDTFWLANWGKEHRTWPQELEPKKRVYVKILGRRKSRNKGEHWLDQVEEVLSCLGGKMVESGVR